MQTWTGHVRCTVTACDGFCAAGAVCSVEVCEVRGTLTNKSQSTFHCHLVILFIPVAALTWKTLANPAASNICKTFCQHCCLLKTCESFQAPVYLVTEKNILKSHGSLQLGSMFLLFSICVSRFADRDLHSIRVLFNTRKTEGMLQELSASTMLQFDL